MNWLDRAEARFGSLAIPGLGRLLVGFNLLVYILDKLFPHTIDLLRLQPALVFQGQVWRLFTFIFIPQVGSFFGSTSPTGELLSLLFYLWFLYFIATGLEHAIGAFKLNVYYAIGMIAIMVSCLFLGGANTAPLLLNATLLFAFARHYPDNEIFIMGIIPVKIKWLAWLEAALLLFMFIVLDFSYRVSLIVCMSNYLLFFGRGHLNDATGRVEMSTRESRSEPEVREASGPTLHECAVCGVTEVKDPYMDFRVARDGKEYCARHLPKAAPEIA